MALMEFDFPFAVSKFELVFKRVHHGRGIGVTRFPVYTVNRNAALTSCRLTVEKFKFKIRNKVPALDGCWTLVHGIQNRSVTFQDRPGCAYPASIWGKPRYHLVEFSTIKTIEEANHCLLTFVSRQP